MPYPVRAFVAVLLSLVIALPAVGHASLPQGARGAPRLVRRTEHFMVTLARGSLHRKEALEFIARLEPTLAVVAERFGTPFNGRERVDILPPQRGACAIRGLTFSGKRQIQLFYGPNTDLDRLQALMAHELVHQLQRERFGDRVQQSADVILLEGWAMVASDDFARTPDGGEPRWQARMREQVRQNAILPLTVDLGRNCRTTTRNTIYDHWASFVAFLEQQYGQEALAAVYASGHGRAAGSADYAQVYGKSFADLEAEWRVWVQGQ